MNILIMMAVIAIITVFSLRKDASSELMGFMFSETSLGQKCADNTKYQTIQVLNTGFVKGVLSKYGYEYPKT